MRQCEALLQAPERDLHAILAASRGTQRRLTGRDRIGLRVGQVIAHQKMAQHCDLEITRMAPPSGATRGTSPRRPSSMASPSFAPACPPTTLASKTRCAPAAASRPSISKSGPAPATAPSACAPTSSCACSPTLSHGTCAASSRPCRAHLSGDAWPPPSVPRGSAAAQLPHAPRRLGAGHQEPSAAPAGPSPAACSPAPRRCGDKHSTCSACAWSVSSTASRQMVDSSNKPMTYVNICSKSSG